MGREQHTRGAVLGEELVGTNRLDAPKTYYMTILGGRVGNPVAAMLYLCLQRLENWTEWKGDKHHYCVSKVAVIRHLYFLEYSSHVRGKKSQHRAPNLQQALVCVSRG
jgi:hypothetical protein